MSLGRVTNGRLIFNEIPKGAVIPGKTTVYDTTETIVLDTVLLEGGVLLKTLVLSVDSYFRSKMVAPDQADESAPYFTVGKPLNSQGVGVVIRSETDQFKVGDHLYGFLDFQQYNVISSKALNGVRVFKNEEQISWATYVGILGWSGQTSYYGWKEYAFPEKGDVVFVSGATGPVGLLVVQFAKADGLKVIAGAGTDEKVAFLKEIGVDVAYNYRTQSTQEILKKEGPINIYWDGIGGEMLEAALSAAASGARFIECGMSSGYWSTPYPVKNLYFIVTKQIKMTGFVVFNPKLISKYLEEFYREIPKKIASGEIKTREHLTKGLENGGYAILDVEERKNLGKNVIVVAVE